MSPDFILEISQIQMHGLGPKFTCDVRIADEPVKPIHMFINDTLTLNSKDGSKKIILEVKEISISKTKVF